MNVTHKKIEDFAHSRGMSCDVCGNGGLVLAGSTDKDGEDLTLRCLQHVDGLHRLLDFAIDLPRVSPDLIAALGVTSLPAPWTPAVRSETHTVAARNDVSWFKAHPDRSYRSRPVMDGDGFSSDKRILVRRVRGGFNRIPVPNAFAWCEGDRFLAALFQEGLVTLWNVKEAVSKGEAPLLTLDMGAVIKRVAFAMLREAV